MSVVNFPYKHIESICKELLAKNTGQVTLFINQGGLANREAPVWAKELFKYEVLPYFTKVVIHLVLFQGRLFVISLTV